MTAYRRVETRDRSGKWLLPLLFKDSLGNYRVRAIFTQKILIEYLLCFRHVVDTSVVT